MIRKLISLLFCAMLLSALCAPALAVDMDYSGPVDPETGEPAGSSQGQSGSSDRSLLSGSMYYDWIRRDFAYPVGDSLSEVHSTAADGMVLTTPVTVSVKGETTLAIYKDGLEYTGSLDRISDVGSYTVSAMVDGQPRRMLSFTLVGASTNVLHTYVVPDGFYILEATRDGEPIFAGRYSVAMEEEGDYVVQYECSATDVVYKLQTTIDRSPTFLTFDGRIDSQGRIRSALKFSGLQTGDRVYLFRSGDSVDLKLESDGTGVITEPGNYRLIVKDPAGNSVEYVFIILQYFNMQSWVFFLMVFAAVVTVLIYVLTKRKRLKIA